MLSSGVSYFPNHMFILNKIFVISGVLMMICLSSCTASIEDIQETASKYEPTREIGRDIEMIYSDLGIIKIKLVAPTVIRHKTDDSHIEFPDGLNVYFYDNFQNVESHLKAKYGIRYEKQEKTIFRDSVYVVNIKKEELFTDELVWDEKEEKIYSNKFVKVITPDERITGTGFEANQDFTNYKVLNISGIINIETQDID